MARGGVRAGSGRKRNIVKALAAEALGCGSVGHIQKIKELAYSPKTPAGVRLSGLVYLVDRELGKPIARNENLDRAGLAHRSDAELIEMAKTLGLPPPPGIKYDDPHSPPAKAP